MTPLPRWSERSRVRGRARSEGKKQGSSFPPILISKDRHYVVGCFDREYRLLRYFITSLPPPSTPHVTHGYNFPQYAGRYKSISLLRCGARVRTIWDSTWDGKSEGVRGGGASRLT